MDLGYAFSFLTKDEGWFKKILLLTLLMFVPILGWFVVLGWSIQFTHRAIRREPLLPLPEIDFSADLVRGFKIWVVNLVWGLPALVSSLIQQVISLSMRAGPSEGAIESAPEAYAGVAMGLVLISCLISILSFAYSLFLAIVQPAAIGNCVDGEYEIGRGLQFGRALSLVRSAPGAYLMILLASILGSFLVLAGFLAFIVGAFFASVYLMPVYAYLWGAAYRQADDKLRLQAG